MPSPIKDTSLVIFLGAHQFPDVSKNFPASRTFLASHNAIKNYFLNPNGFGLSDTTNLLDLFDSPDNAININITIADWLKQRVKVDHRQKPITDLFIYYTGHGGFEHGGKEYYLAIRSTLQDDPYGHSIQIKRLAIVLRNHARFLRRYLILDACFAGAALLGFQSPLEEVVRQKVATIEWSSAEFPSKGTSLLCATSAMDPAKMVGPYTMFSGALIKVLTSGQASMGEYLTFRDLQGLTAMLIRNQFGDEGVHPEIHSPQQSMGGDIADLAVFPNQAYQPDLTLDEQNQKDLYIGIHEMSGGPSKINRSYDGWVYNKDTRVFTNTRNAGERIIIDDRSIEVEVNADWFKKALGKQGTGIKVLVYWYRSNGSNEKITFLLDKHTRVYLPTPTVKNGEQFIHKRHYMVGEIINSLSVGKLYHIYIRNSGVTVR